MVSDDSGGIISIVSEKIGASEPALKLLLSILAGYPLALVYRKYIHAQPTTVKHQFFLATGLSLGLWNYGLDIFHSVFAVFFTYLTILIFGGTNICVAITFLFNLGYLLIGYVYAATDDYDINWTLPQCVLVLRLIAVAYDLYDGHQPAETLSSENKKVALLQRPNLLELFGFCFFPAGFLVGPQFALKRYQDFVSGTFCDKENPAEPPSSCVAPAVIRFLLGVFYLVAFQILGFWVSDEYVASDEFYTVGFFSRCFLLGVWGRYTLYKYLSCWLLTEGACILFGLTYNGENDEGKPEWNGLANVDLWRLETATEFNHYIQSFNINTNHWVLQYIYKRLKFLGNRHVSQAAALLFLAIWHGFHTGYYFCFFFEFMVMYMEKDVRPMIEKNEKVSTFLKTNPVSTAVYIVQRIYTFVFMGWCLLPFALLTFDRYWKAYGNVNYIGFILFVAYPFVYRPILKRLLKTKTREDKQN